MKVMEFSTPEEYWQYEMLRRGLEGGVTHQATAMEGITVTAPAAPEVLEVVPEVPEAHQPAPPGNRRTRMLNRIGAVYVTPQMNDAIELLRMNPAGLTTRELVVAIYGEPKDGDEETMAALVRTYSRVVNKAVRETGTVRKVKGTLTYVLTDLGRVAPLKVHPRPWNHNRTNKALMRYMREVLAGAQE